MKQSIKKYLSGSLKNRVGNKLPTLRLFIILFLANVAYADDISNTNNYLPNGKYRLFGSGRGEVHNIDNQIRLHGQLSQQAGNLHIQTSLYQGNLSYQQHFHNHGHSVHSPFENKAQRNFSAKKGSIVQGGATLTDLSVTGYEIHPADAYDGEQGGGYPLPTGARDEYLYEVNGKEVSVKVVALDKLPNKTHDNQLLRKAGIDPAKYEQPQNNDERVQIERLTYTNNTSSNANNFFYSNLSELGRNGQGWNTAEIRQPEPLLNNPTVKKDSNDVSVNQHFASPVTIVIPPSSVRFGRIIPATKWAPQVPYDPNAPIVVNRQFASPKPAAETFPYDRLTTLKLPFENDKKSQGNTANNNQNDYDNPPILGYYDDGDDSAHSDNEDYDYNYGYNYGYDDDDYYGGNHQNQQQPDTAENKSSFEDDILALCLSPPPPFTEYDDGTKNNTNTANNYPTQNNDDWQAEKWDNDSPFNVNKAELAVELGNLVNEGVLSLATRNKLLIKSDDAAIPAAIASGDVDYIATAANISPAEAEALLSRLTAKGGSKAGNAGKNVAKNTPTTSGGTIYVDSKGNAIPTLKGGSISGSPDGKFIQVRDQNGKLTGARIDGGHNSATHPDPRAQTGHAHVPGVTNNDGTPWLPIKQ